MEGGYQTKEEIGVYGSRVSSNFLESGCGVEWEYSQVTCSDGAGRTGHTFNTNVSYAKILSQTKEYKCNYEVKTYYKWEYSVNVGLVCNAYHAGNVEGQCEAFAAEQWAKSEGTTVQSWLVENCEDMRGRALAWEEHHSTLGLVMNDCHGGMDGKPGLVYNKWWYADTPVDENTDTLQSVHGSLGIETGWCKGSSAYNTRRSHFRAVYSGWIGFACVEFNGNLPQGCDCSYGERVVLSDCAGVTHTDQFVDQYWAFNAASLTDCRIDVRKVRGPNILKGTLDVGGPDSDCYQDTTMNWPGSGECEQIARM
ncbi:unnamed protein product [Cylindrotheca closterium]|uniref:Uncharacterized protein n=1 Tax=Cylindrotheca closterium TaxID=2856 RepID=A0AAD2CFQ1_9STRA|nr:unnamed protein product [Cylindrotheca closterium]